MSAQDVKTDTPSAVAPATPPVAPDGSAPAIRSPLLGSIGWSTILTTVPIYVGILIIWIYFDTQTAGHFISSRNLSEMAQEYSYKAVLALGVVLVLLLGEIDLSLGYLTLLSVCMTAVFSQSDGMSAGVSIVLSIAICTILGLLQGLFIAWVRIPSFVVTLGGFLIFEGFAYHLVQGSTINVFDPFIGKIGTTYLSSALGWILVILAIAAFAGSRLWTNHSRAQAGLPTKPVAQSLLPALGVAIALAIVVATLNRYRGVPLPFFLLGLFTLLFWLFAKKTRFGRHIYAVGGNIEASRRAGINTTAVRWIVFGISGLMGGVAGIMLVGYTAAASTTTAGPDLLLDVISIAVIGGVSLLGGRGSVWAVLLGGLLISSIDSGLNLMATDPNYVYVIKGAILLAAILIDTLGKRGGLPAFLRRPAVS